MPCRYSAAARMLNYRGGTVVSFEIPSIPPTGLSRMFPYVHGVPFNAAWPGAFRFLVSGSYDGVAARSRNQEVFRDRTITRTARIARRIVLHVGRIPGSTSTSCYRRDLAKMAEIKEKKA